MIFREKNGISFFQFPALVSHAGLFHAVFTRRGGVSGPPFDSLNMSFGLGDDPQKVKKNRKRISDCAAASVLVFMDQVHGDAVWRLKAGADGGSSKAPALPCTDAVITDMAGKILVVQVADCQPVFLFDPVRRAVAAVHAGWRGSIGGILGGTVRSMSDTFGCRPEDLVACIGPSLGPCCAEFIHYADEIPRPFWVYKDGGNHFDFWSITRDQLVDAGLDREKVFSSGLCTRCRKDLFFSYRRDKVTGRFAGAIGLLAL